MATATGADVEHAGRMLHSILARSIATFRRDLIVVHELESTGRSGMLIDIIDERCLDRLCLDIAHLSLLLGWRWWRDHAARAVANSVDDQL